MKFKVNDKVVVIKGYRVNCSGTVVSTINDGYVVHLDDDEGISDAYYDENELEFFDIINNRSQQRLDNVILKINTNLADTSVKAVKFDNGKADLSILSYEALSQIAKAFEFGAKKYGRYNYLGGMQWTRISSALLRHVFAWVWGEDKDSESGLPHLAHAGACVVMLLDYVLKGLGTDDRHKG